MPQRYGNGNANGGKHGHENARIEPFYSNAEIHLPSCEAEKPDRSVLFALLCPSLSEKYAASSDGTLWMFADNYFVSFENGEPRFAVRSVRGMRRGERGGERLMSSKELYCSEYAFSEESYDSPSGFLVTVFHGERDVKGDILCATADGYSSPVLYDFTRFFEKG